MPRSTIFLLSVAVVLLFLVAAGTYSFVLLRRRRSLTWRSLVDQLAVVDRTSIALLANDLSGAVEDDSHAEPLDAIQIWNLTGGMEGLATLEKNCDVLVNLAFYLQQRYPQALPVAERLRMQEREIRWHVDRLRSAAERGHLQTSFADYAQRAAAIYQSMTLTVLALYEQVGAPQLMELEALL